MPLGPRGERLSPNIKTMVALEVYKDVKGDEWYKCFCCGRTLRLYNAKGGQSSAARHHQVTFPFHARGLNWCMVRKVEIEVYEMCAGCNTTAMPTLQALAPLVGDGMLRVRGKRIPFWTPVAPGLGLDAPPLKPQLVPDGDAPLDYWVLDIWVNADPLKCPWHLPALAQYAKGASVKEMRDDLKKSKPHDSSNHVKLAPNFTMQNLLIALRLKQGAAWRPRESVFKKEELEAHARDQDQAMQFELEEEEADEAAQAAADTEASIGIDYTTMKVKEVVSEKGSVRMKNPYANSRAGVDGRVSINVPIFDVKLEDDDATECELSELQIILGVSPHAAANRGALVEYLKTRQGVELGDAHALDHCCLSCGRSFSTYKELLQHQPAQAPARKSDNSKCKYMRERPDVRMAGQLRLVPHELKTSNPLAYINEIEEFEPGTTVMLRWPCSDLSGMHGRSGKVISSGLAQGKQGDPRYHPKIIRTVRFDGAAGDVFVRDADLRATALPVPSAAGPSSSSRPSSSRSPGRSIRGLPPMSLSTRKRAAGAEPESAGAPRKRATADAASRRKAAADDERDGMVGARFGRDGRGELHGLSRRAAGLFPAPQRQLGADAGEDGEGEDGGEDDGEGADVDEDEGEDEDEEFANLPDADQYGVETVPVDE